MKWFSSSFHIRRFSRSAVPWSFVKKWLFTRIRNILYCVRLNILIPRFLFITGVKFVLCFDWLNLNSCCSLNFDFLSWNKSYDFLTYRDMKFDFFIRKWGKNRFWVWFWIDWTFSLTDNNWNQVSSECYWLLRPFDICKWACLNIKWSEHF